MVENAPSQRLGLVDAARLRPRPQIQSQRREAGSLQ